VQKGTSLAITAAAGLLAAAFMGTASTATMAAPRAPARVVRPGLIELGAAATSFPTTAQCVKTMGVPCYWPSQLQGAYNLGPLFKRGIEGQGQTIIIVDSFGSPTIRHDLSVFDKQFTLPAPPSFKIINPVGPNPRWNASNNTMTGWGAETTLDVEWAHAIAPKANILLVETPVAETEGVTGFPQIVAAEDYVIRHHMGGVISQSFGATEETFPGGLAEIKKLRLRNAIIAADEPKNNITVLAASGDAGATDLQANQTDYYTRPVTSWPASDPDVTGVGGTEIKQGGDHAYYSVAWNDTFNPKIVGSTPTPTASGGGLSVFFPRPSFQDGVASVVGGARGVPDIAMSAACSGTVLVYESFRGGTTGWSPICGTSEATPQFAGIVALADQVAGHSLGDINPTLYQLSADKAPGIVDVTSGDNSVQFTQGTPARTYHIMGWNAGPGYSPVDGVGTVNAAYLVYELARKPVPRVK